MSGRTLPLIGIPSCVRSIHERAFHTVNERYTNAVIEAVGGLPLLTPPLFATCWKCAVIVRMPLR